MENERNVSPVSAHAFNNEKPPCESRVASLSKKQYFIFMLRAAARIQSNLLCKFINSGSMYLGIYTREEKMCPQDAVFLRDSLESVVSLYLGIINCSNRAVLDGGIAMPIGTAGACRRIQLMVRLTDIDSYAIGGRRNAHCTLTVCKGEHAVRVRYRAVDRAQR